MERDIPTLPTDAAKDISTHTLTWSVTYYNPEMFPDIIISTHTLTWSVTYDPLPSKSLSIFQLTRSRGA